ncbi:unnamed protein product [Danaus chrysippus]|uniref:(African queen) hypothetical protein n=1 Tax=Danaus chrysippus TaxID=151541 RepID=A0A8J2W5I4_9NEOP|nr:unnamed protein product [Danaus chrysippus]
MVVVCNRNVLFDKALLVIEQNNENTDPEWLADLRANISQVVNELGYDESKSQIQQLVEDPLWLTQFKGFVKSLVQSYGLEKSKEMLRHMVKSLEKKYHVNIQDVDGKYKTKKFDCQNLKDL